MEECKESENGLAGYQCTLVSTKFVTMEQLWDWEKVENIHGAGYLSTGPDSCA